MKTGWWIIGLMMLFAACGSDEQSAEKTAENDLGIKSADAKREANFAKIA